MHWYASTVYIKFGNVLVRFMSLCTYSGTLIKHIFRGFARMPFLLGSLKLEFVGKIDILCACCIFHKYKSYHSVFGTAT